MRINKIQAMAPFAICLDNFNINCIIRYGASRSDFVSIDSIFCLLFISRQRPPTNRFYISLVLDTTLFALNGQLKHENIRIIRLNRHSKSLVGDHQNSQHPSSRTAVVASHDAFSILWQITRAPAAHVLYTISVS